jgi:hypothetical protein
MLNPGETAEHTEQWWLFKDVPAGDSESWIEQVVLPFVNTSSI